MPDILDPLDQVLDHHAEAISKLEIKLTELAGKSVDPIRLQEVMGKVGAHTERLNRLLQIFPTTK
jgi:hypothetical protein